MSIKRFTGVITKGEQNYVAHCLELGVVSDGRTIEEARDNLKEAVVLYIGCTCETAIPESTEEVLVYPLEVA